MGGPSSLGFFWGRFDVLSEFPVGHAGSKMADQVSLEAFTIKPPPDKFESGEPAFGEVIGWGGAIEYWTSLGLERIAAYSRRLATTAARELASIERIRVVGAPRDRVAVVSFAVDGIKAGDVEQLLDRDGIEVRAGTLESQPQLAALGFKEAVRASFSFYNTEAEVSALVEAVKRIAG
jgi:cysteine desulfurase/selenocysteine lyase